MYRYTGIAGILFILAPFIFSYTNNPFALWTSIIGGFVVLMVSVWEGLQIHQQRWEYHIAGITGTVAILTPFVFGFTSHTIAMWTVVIMGSSIALMSASRLWLRRT